MMPDRIITHLILLNEVCIETSIVDDTSVMSGIPSRLMFNLFSIVFIITKTRPCNIQRFLKLSKMKIFNRKILIFFLFLLKT